jgi:hypothetical protein
LRDLVGPENSTDDSSKTTNTRYGFFVYLQEG